MENRLQLQELIDKIIEQGILNGDDTLVTFDFTEKVPYSVHSYRGHYEDLAIDYTVEDGSPTNTIDNIVEMLEYAIGETYEGWKGGDFKMDKDSTVWVSHEGRCGERYIYKVEYSGEVVVLKTRTEDWL